MTPAIELAENGENKMMTVEELLASCGVGSPEELIKMIGDLKGSIEASSAKEKEMQEKIEMSEKTSKFNALMSEGKAVEAQRDAFFKNDMIEFAKNAQPLKLAEVTVTVEGEEKSAEDEVLELAEKKVKEDKMPLAQAIAMVLSENKELNKKYRGE
jgi:hypothetical protein